MALTLHDPLGRRRRRRHGFALDTAVKKDPNVPLLREINGSLADLRTSGVYDKIFTTYFG